MTLADAARLAEEHSARLAASTLALRELLAASLGVISPSADLMLAQLRAQLALEEQPVLPPTREDLCQRKAWCSSRAGHAGECVRIGAPGVGSDFGPDAARKRRY